MQNPIVQALASRSPQAAQVRQLFSMVKNAGNPQVMLNQMMASNPKMKEVMDFVNQNGGDPKRAFYALAKQKGVDPEEILKELR